MVTPKRRAQDQSNIVLQAAKATAAFLFFGALSFVGTWSVGLNSSVAKLKEDVAVIHEKQEFLGPWLYDEVKHMRQEVGELRKDVQSLRDGRRP